MGGQQIQLNELTKMYDKYKLYIVLIILFFIFLIFLYYISQKLSLKKNNCQRIQSIITKNTGTNNIATIDGINLDDNINNFFIKTAYNCCCAGNFKNDYVDMCALKNCAYQGVRALDFQIYSLKNKPIISASTMNTNKYKEIYNYLDFYETMVNVKRFFINDPTYSSNLKDPLFLIFRLYSTNSVIYDVMANTLNELFGYSNPAGNLIYIASMNKILDNESIKNLNGKVVIIVDTTYGDSSKFNSSKLNKYNSLQIGTLNNNIYREENSLIQLKKINSDASKNLTFLYPDLGFSSSNYDYVTKGVFNNISFIGMNYQTNDKYLKNYDSMFTVGSVKSAFINKQTYINTLTNTPAYNSYMTALNK